MVWKLWSSKQLVEVTGFSAAYLTQLKQQGVIRPHRRDEWPMPGTLRAIVADLRRRNKQGESNSEAQLRSVKEKLLALRLSKEKRELISLDEALNSCSEVVGTILAELDACRSWSLVVPIWSCVRKLTTG
jgi:hypothetical protein